MIVFLVGFGIGLLMTQSLPFWDGDFTIFFTAIQDKSLAKLVGDLLSPITEDTRNWGFLDHTVQLIIYKIGYLLVGWESWPYVWFRAACYGGIGYFIYLWSLRLVADSKYARYAGAAAAVLFVAAPAPIASMSWIADFAPVAEFAVAGITFLLWAEIEKTPTEWSEVNFWSDPARRAWVLRWTGLAILTYFAYKTKSDVKLITPFTALYLFLTRRSQWKVFLPPVTLMALLAVPWNAEIFKRVPPFLPGGQGGSENFMWQPAKLSRLTEFLWSSNPYNLRDPSLSLAGLLGPFLLVGVVALFVIRPLPAGTLRFTFETPQRRAHLYVSLWFLAILAGATALPPLNYFFRIRYGILTLLPVSILLASAFGWYCQTAFPSDGSKSTLPKWLIIGPWLLFLVQLTVNLDRSIMYRRQFGTVESGVDQTYEFIAKNYPNDDLALMPDFLSYDYHLDAPPAIKKRRVISGLDELARAFVPNKTTVLSWQKPASPMLQLVKSFNGCRADSWFDKLTDCPQTLDIYLSRYVGGPSVPTPLTPMVERTRAAAQAALNRSFALCQAQQSKECIAAAQEALRLDPNYPEAYNNLAAAYEALGMWDEAIQAATEAIRLKPDFQLAKNNLAWSLSQKKINAPPPAPAK